MKKVMMILVLLISVLPLTSCGKDDLENKQGTNLVVIAGKHANANSFTEEMISEMKKKIDESYSYYLDENDGLIHIKCNTSVIISDGSPTKEDMDIPLEMTLEEEDFINQFIGDTTNSIIDYINDDNVKATEEEVDLLAALGEAQTIINQNPAPKNNILILDTGISTTGYMDMKDIDIKNDDVDKILNSVNSSAFPILKNGNAEIDTDDEKNKDAKTHVTFLGMGNVAKPQKDFRKDNVYKNKLVELWTKVLEEKCEAIIDDTIQFSESSGKAYMYAEEGNGYPYVSVADFGFTDFENANDIIVLDSQELGFEPSSAKFRHGTTQAVKAIKPFANKLITNNEYKKQKIYVVGSIAVDESGKQFTKHDISYNRAKAVTDILLSLGVEKSRIVVLDGGTTKFSWRNENEFENGNWSSLKAQKNRVVSIIPESCKSKVDELKKLK